ncbi:MAG: hypothetical protein ABIL22_03015 [candidate division WOR-3 bacterium]
MKSLLQSLRYILSILVCLTFINCPKRPSVKTSTIEVIYLSSLLADIQKPEPFLCSIKDSKGLKVGYLNFETPFMFQIFQRLGFYKFLNDVPLDFLITNYPVYQNNFLSIPVDLGYGIKNLEGIRFAICSQYRDSLTISDQVKLATIRERSDVLWVVDKKILSIPPAQIDFIIKNRILEDTIIRQVKPAVDTTLLVKLKEFNQLLNQTLNATLLLNNSTPADYVFLKIKEKKSIDVMLFPKDMIKDNTPKNSITISGFLSNVACDTKFKLQEMKKDEVNRIARENNYTILGKITKNNVVLVPDKEGEYLFDLLFY